LRFATESKQVQPELKSDRFPATVLPFFPVSKPEEMLHGAAGSSRKVFVDVCFASRIAD